MVELVGSLTNPFYRLLSADLNSLFTS